MALDVLVVSPLHHELEGILTKLDEPIKSKENALWVPSSGLARW